MEVKVQVGSLTAVYTSTQYDAGACPRVGDWFWDTTRKAKFVFLKNSGSSAITEELACMALTTGKTNFTCTLAAATVSLAPFAGVRVTGATSMAQNEYGWFQISGSATFQAGSDTTTAELGVVTSNQGAGKVEAAPDTGVGANATFGIAETTTSAGDVVVSINRNVWGI